jgi:hypothetical protein
MRNVLGLLIVALICAFAYKYYFSKLQPSDTATPAQTITAVGVKNDLIAIAQAERTYQAEHGSYATLEELTSSGAMTLLKPGRDGYQYEVESSSTGFTVNARCPAATTPGCTNWTIDETMEVRAAP